MSSFSRSQSRAPVAKPELAIASREEERVEMIELNDRLEAYGAWLGACAREEERSALGGGVESLSAGEDLVVKFKPLSTIEGLLHALRI
jgi:hypothetical protein